MKKQELIALLAKAKGVPFRRSTLEAMQPEELAHVANEYGAGPAWLRKIGSAGKRLDRLEAELEDADLLENRGSEVELGFPVRNILDAPRGESVLDDDPGDGSAENASNLGFPVQPIMDGPRGASALD